MKLGNKQLSRIRSITNRIEMYYGSGSSVNPPLSFSLRILSRTGKGAVMLCADNTANLKWYETFYRCCITIGPLGGIERYEGTMRPKLVLPVVPSLCEYEDPFKK